jgi:hypothetical protein
MSATALPDTERGYAIAFVISLLGWPVFLYQLPVHWWALIAAANIVIYVAVAHRLSTPALTFFSSLVALAKAFRSGIVNLTIIYIVPVLAFFYLIALGYAITGIAMERALSAGRWRRFVAHFVPGSELPDGKRPDGAQKTEDW